MGVLGKYIYSSIVFFQFMQRKRMGLVLSIVLLLLLCSCSNVSEYSETRELMGTFVEITVIESNSTKARNAMTKAFSEISRVEQIFSNYINTSAVSVLNKKGEVKANEEFNSVLLRSLYYSDMSSGAFDITVQPVLSLFTRTYTVEKRPPTSEELEAACALVGYDKIVVSGDLVMIDEGMEITLGGIAKGYAVDRAIAVLQEEGISNALVNAGGDMRAIGSKRGSPWIIALQNPRDRSDYITIIELEDKAIATSGDYERYFVPNKTVHHILDPKTCKSAEQLISVTIIADDATTADALSTTVYVLGPDEGISLVEELESVEALIIDEERRIIKSSGFPD